MWRRNQRESRNFQICWLSQLLCLHWIRIPGRKGGYRGMINFRLAEFQQKILRENEAMLDGRGETPLTCSLETWRYFACFSYVKYEQFTHTWHNKTPISLFSFFVPLFMVSELFYLNQTAQIETFFWAHVSIFHREKEKVLLKDGSSEKHWEELIICLLAFIWNQ